MSDDYKIKLRSEVKLAVQDVLEKEFPFQSCINCLHFDLVKDLDYCKLHKAKPPARIIVYGCEQWEWVPF